MRYIGGKSKLSKRICTAVLEAGAGCHTYLEPFVGGGATMATIAPHFATSYAGDVSPDLVLMWQAVRDGWLPPESVSESEYQSMRLAPESALRGFVGFGCSFGGKWFGGRARGGFNADGTPRDHSAESSRAVRRLSEGFRGVDEIKLLDYRDWSPGSGWVVYADPPYDGTQGYAAAGMFNSCDFWDCMNEWTDRGAVVLVSEYNAPPGWAPVAEFSHIRSLQHGRDGRHATTEVLWARER